MTSDPVGPVRNLAALKLQSALGGVPVGADVDLARQAAFAGELENQLNGSKKDSPEKIKSAATQFEALLLQQMFKSMWESVPKDGMLTGGREEELYRDMLNEALAKNVSETRSIGIKDVIAADMLKNIERSKK